MLKISHLCRGCFVLFTLFSLTAHAQEGFGIRDSVVVDGPDGSHEVTYLYHARPAEVLPAPVSPSVNTLNSEQGQMPSPPVVNASSEAISMRDLSAYSVGSIPIQKSVSPTGARLYSIPISAVPGCKLSPSLSLVYNSQSGYNVAGYGWGLSGISSIELRNKVYYYDDEYRGTVYDSSDAVYSLDGNPIVRSAMGLNGYTYETTQGHIQIKKHLTATGAAAYFTVLYPNGTTGIFGFRNNTTAKNSYPLTELTDIQGNRISFSYSNYGNVYYISRIDYGDDASTVFTWSYSPERPIIRYASFGQSLTYPLKLLKTITCNDGNEELCRYTLTHETKDGVSLLTEVGCSASSNTLPPLQFTYGIDRDTQSGASPTFTLADESLYYHFFTKTADHHLIYKRGKLIPGSQREGIVILPSYSTYAQIGYTNHWYDLHRYYKYGSAYAANQEILCDLDGYHSPTQSIILAESGFQLIEPVDVDGDGTDDLVKINSSCSVKGVTDYKITIYSYNEDYTLSSRYFTVSVNDGTSNKYYNNPAKSFYQFGDFRGNGKAMLLIMTRDKSRFVLVDLDAGSKVSDSTLFSLSDEEINLVLSNDFENDGQSDLCHITDSGMDVYSLSSMSGGTFSLRVSYSGISKNELYEDPNFLENGRPKAIPAKLYPLDINGDGYLDIAAAPASFSYNDVVNNPRLCEFPDVYYNTYTWNIARFDGKGFYTETTSLFKRNKEDSIIFLDVDKDGLPDMLRLHNSRLFYFPNINGTFTSQNNYANIELDETSDLIPGDASIYGKQGDLIVASGAFMRLYRFGIDHAENRRVFQMIDSFGRVNTNTYGDIRTFEGSYAIDYSRSYSSSAGFKRCRIPLSVLTYEQTDVNWRHIEELHYSYYDAVYNNRGLGFCGFGKIYTSDYVSGNYMKQVFDPERFGVITETSVSKTLDGTPFSLVTNTYDNHATAYGKLSPRLVESVETDALTGTETTVNTTYGSYDLPTTIVTSRRIGSGPSQTETIIRTYENSISASKYVLGLVTEEVVTKEIDGNSVSSWKEKSVNTYDLDFRPVISKHYVGENNLYQVSETRWTYDTHGNVISEKTAPYGGTEFVGKTYTYDADGRYLLSETDALGNTISYSGYNKFGKPTTVTDFLNGVTTYTYDGFGKLTETVSPDGSVETTSVAWGGDGLYTVSSTATGKPEAVVHYDAQGREIKSGVKRFDGQWQWTDKEYDGKGRLYRTSLPHRGESALYWNTYHYDEYNRPDSLVEASGKVSTWAYSGTTITSVSDGITSTKTTDAAGNVVSVTDAGGTITYSYRDDGQLSSVCAPGNVVTSFTYDEYGRKTSMNDPSAGLQTEAYVWNADGSSMFTHTNPNGTVRTYKDKYGRTTMVERPGEYNTLYNYDSYGRASSEQSTNGTGTEYAYDNLGRVAWAKETVPDGKWLKKAYTYGSGSTLASTQYTSQSGLITTETYSYANGYNTGVNLTDGTVVWSLESENDLGMATEITSGSINRQYGFTPFGMPTYRKMDDGVLQDFTYQFDNHTGNLLLRQDGVNGHIETFGYDGLNRLTDMGNRHVSYAQNGNISSISGVGLMYYENPSKPYQLTTLGFVGLDDIGNVANRQQSITYTCYSRPSILIEGERSAAFTYNGTGDRVKMYVAEGTTPVLTRYYVGGQYEYDQTPGGTKERLYLDGDAYSSPMVLQRENGGSWTAYNIGRDYLGNITHIATLDGTLVAEYSYDPWGRLRNPSTLEIYAPGSEPELFLGRGFTGHEHLTWFGLINMNARLYDPLLGRFLSPDPYVQAPDFTQNFNRYSYALNNPLKYEDENGEFIGLAIAMGGFINWYLHGQQFSLKGLGYFGIGALAGALTAVGGAWAAQAIAAEGVALGALVGAGTAGLSGGLSSYLANGLNNIIDGNRFGQNGLQSFLTGAVSAAILGAISGGLEGGKRALDSDKNVWWGSKVKRGRSQWSFFNYEDPWKTITFDGIKDMGRHGNLFDCFPDTLAEIENYYTGGDSYDYYSKYYNYVPEEGTTMKIKTFEDLIKAHFKSKSMGIGILTHHEDISKMAKDGKLIAFFSPDFAEGKAHADVIRKVLYYDNNRIMIELRSGVVNIKRFYNNAKLYQIWGVL